jgi:hypothetical protein
MFPYLSQKRMCCTMILKRMQLTSWNKILNIKPCISPGSHFKNILLCEYWRKSMIIGEKNTDLKRLTGRIKLRFLTEIGRFHWNQGKEVAHFAWFGEPCIRGTETAYHSWAFGFPSSSEFFFLLSEWVSDYCLTPNEQFSRYIMARTS